MSKENQTSKSKISGLFVPHITPYDQYGKLNEKELRHIVSWLISKGVDGLYPNGSMGEFVRLSFEEQLKLLEIVVDETAGRVPILAGAAEPNIDQVLEVAQRASELGCRAISVTGPYYYSVSQESIECYFTEIAKHTPIDMLLYNIPAFANEISLPVLERLALNNKKIVGVKDSSGDLTRLMHCMNRIKAKRPDFSTLVGWEGIFIPAMLMGADGGALSSAGVVPEIYVKMMKAFNEGNFTESKEIQLCVLDLFQTMLEATNFPEGFREGYAIRGFNPGRARMRLSASEETAMGGVRLEIAKILSDFGYSNAKSIYRKYQEKTCQLVL